jgi:quinoprotein glucose dehydrogenase
MPDLRERDMWGMSLIDQMICRIEFRQATYHGIYTPPTTETRWIQYPSYNGGSDWGGIAVDPRRGVIIANYSDLPNYNRLVPRDEATRRGWAPRDQARGGDMSSGAEGAGDPQMGVPFAVEVNAGWRLPSTGLLCKQPPYGGIRAIDLRTGRTIWDRPLGTARGNGPWGIPSLLPINIGTPNNGGAVVTAGGLVFIAAATDNLIRAIDVETGATLWQDLLPAGGQANPMVYEVGGRQYLVIMAGGHHFMGTPPEITSSLTRCRNARGAPNPREQHHQHAGQDRHGQAQPSAANNVEPGDCKEPGDAAEYDGDRGNIELALELWRR